MSIKVVHIKPEFEDERGYISRLVDTDEYPLRTVLYITSKKGTLRGNHLHKKDAHFVYCLSGMFRYSEKDFSNKKSRKLSVILKSGDIVLSRPGIAHSMEFLEDTVFLAFTTEKRDQGEYEADIQRVKIT